ncbi:hypothetical protein [Telluribacter humicola]|uniref:hypothetical protein n=1 Tax=Telluribacter humicola TaxID=1720261 RepID=UPI001A95CAEF|nr:hypothetical protein [Telluribacter humicola]
MKNHYLNLVAIVAGILAAGPAIAQHEHHQQPTPKADTTTTDHSMHRGHNMHGDAGMQMGGMRHMTHAFSLSLPMTRNGSGTSWQPDATPMYAYMHHGRNWNYMVHGSVFLQYNGQNINNKGRKGSESAFNVPNWVMGMAQRQVGQNGLVTVRSMVSLDRVFDGGAGYPLLYQSGETWQDQPLIDRQHPHDFISELAVGYTQRFGPKVDASVYVGYPGEPALGPTAFMHRMSAFNNPNATLGHHWQDATHITFGVVTAGVRYGDFKVEASRFTGREPDENRFDFDRPRFDSYSYRLMYNPTDNWAFQVSRGFIRSPEVSHPDEDVHRTTASAQHSVPLLGSPSRWISSTLVWGLNDAGHGHVEHSALLESNLQLDRWGVYGRYEWVQKSPEELFIEAPETFPHDKLFPVSGLTLGVTRQIASFANTLLQLGGQATFYTQDAALESYYGKNPLSAQVYLRLTPGLMRMGM